ncbi:MAG: M20/M25/M40 family metallo-hydrolase [Proteobacteria bacterium]|nr:M20/M25/M40 family metallo-hydrolase [Pseudomonadota bacterium]
MATAAQGRVATGETVFILSARHVMGWRGLTGALRRLGHVDSIFVVGASPRDVAAIAGAKAISARARYMGTLVESVQGSDATAMLGATLGAAGAALPADAGWLTPPAVAATARAPRKDIYEEAERTVMSLLDLPGVPGHEWRVRNAVRNALPAWAQKVATVDSAGNLIVAAGPDRDSVAFIAHTDEVSFEVERVMGDGTVTLAPRGGAILSAWEGQPAVLAFDPDASGNTASPLWGVFVPRDSAKVKRPSRLVAWFGLDSATLVAGGVRPGSAVLGDKHATRLAGTRVTGRASDDRTGSTALLLAVQHVDPAKLPRKVFFVWATREEIGLFGARAWALTYATSLQRVYAVDTFVSSDTPLEQPMFAFAPLGQGAVLRGLDDATVVSRAERDRVIRTAKVSGIKLQVGTTHGGTDGSAVAAFGVPDIGISWPGRYSHTPGEVLDLRDLDALSRLIAALAVAR